jgi:hypothetical protein
MIATGPKDREHFNANRPTCLSNRCGHFGTYTDDGDAGCLLLVSYGVCPGKISKHLLHGGGCPADPPLFPPADQTLDKSTAG